MKEYIELISYRTDRISEIINVIIYYKDQNHFIRHREKKLPAAIYFDRTLICLYYENDKFIPSSINKK